MQEAFKVLARAKQDAERRLRQYEEEGRKSAHKVLPVKHAIRELDEAYKWLGYINSQRTELVRLWLKVEEGSKGHVQIHSSNTGGPRRSQGNRRKP